MYEDIPEIHQIFIFDFSLIEDNEFYHEFMFRDENNVPLTQNMKIHYIELTKLPPLKKVQIDDMSPLEFWALLFKYFEKKEFHDILGKSKIFYEEAKMTSENSCDISQDMIDAAYALSREKWINDTAAEEALRQRYEARMLQHEKNIKEYEKKIQEHKKEIQECKKDIQVKQTQFKEQRSQFEYQRSQFEEQQSQFKEKESQFENQRIEFEKDKTRLEEQMFQLHQQEKSLSDEKHRAAIQTASNFLKMGLSPEQVAAGTGLSVEEVQKISGNL